MTYEEMLSKLMEQVDLTEDNISIFDNLRAMSPTEWETKYNTLADNFRKRWGEGVSTSVATRQDSYYKTTENEKYAGPLDYSDLFREEDNNG